MPGIVGLISSAPPDECERVVRAMLATMMHENSYVSGTHVFPEMGAYGGWVAHEASMAERVSKDRSETGVAILMSGEFSALGAGSQEPSRTAQYAARTQDEPVFSLYEREEERFIEKLDGLFSGLLIDPQRKRALLFNDRHGCERIYHYEKNGATYFASEAKALLRVLPELRAFDDQGVAQFLSYGCTLDGRTLFRGIGFLPGGSVWSFHAAAGSSRKRYFEPEQWASQPPLTEGAFDRAYRETFERILPRYLNDAKSLGISLTGGLDTRMIMAGVASAGIRPVCYTFSGAAGDTLDVRLAARVARACGLEHHTLRVGNDFVSEFGHHVDRTAFVTDGCAGALAAHEIYLNAQARELAPIRLTGNYGSEILRGMSTFKRQRLISAILAPDFRNLVAGTAVCAPEEESHPVSRAAFQEIPWLHYGTLAAGRSQLTFRTPYLDSEIVRLAFRAPESARQSSRTALSLVHAHSPILAEIPTDRGLAWGGHGLQQMGRRLFAELTFKLDYLHKEGLPGWLSPLDPLFEPLSCLGLLGLHKFLPYRLWFRRDVAKYVDAVLGDPSTQRMPYWDSHFLPKISSDHVKGKGNYMREINAILSLEAVERTLLRAGETSTRLPQRHVTP